MLNWTDLSAAKRLLRELACDAPMQMLIVGKSLAGHRTETVTYDEEDHRIIALKAVREAWFEMASDVAAVEWIDLDDAITAAIAAEEAQEAKLDRVTAFINDGYTLGEARRMADDITNSLEA